MSIHDVFLRWPLLAEAAKILHEQRMYVTIGHDFNEYRRVVSQGRPHQPVSLPFAAEMHNLSKDNAFWICGYTEQGALAHTQAVRLVDVGEQSLGSYLQRSFPCRCCAGYGGVTLSGGAGRQANQGPALLSR